MSGNNSRNNKFAGPKKSGALFAANSLVLQGVSAIAALIAGPLAENVFEPLFTAPAQGPFLLHVNRQFGHYRES